MNVLCVECADVASVRSALQLGVQLHYLLPLHLELTPRRGFVVGLGVCTFASPSELIDLQAWTSAVLGNARLVRTAQKPCFARIWQAAIMPRQTRNETFELAAMCMLLGMRGPSCDAYRLHELDDAAELRYEEDVVEMLELLVHSRAVESGSDAAYRTCPEGEGLMRELRVAVGVVSAGCVPIREK